METDFQIFQSTNLLNIMSLNFKPMLVLALASLLVACGGGSSTYTVTRNWEGTTYSCPSPST